MRVKVNIYAEEAFWGFDAENETEKSPVRVTSTDTNFQVPAAYRGPHTNFLTETTFLELAPGAHTIYVVDTYGDGWNDNQEAGGRWEAAMLKPGGCILKQPNELIPVVKFGGSYVTEVPETGTSPGAWALIRGFCKAAEVDCSKLTITNTSEQRPGQLAIQMEIAVSSRSAAEATVNRISSAAAASIEASIAAAGGNSGVGVVTKAAVVY